MNFNQSYFKIINNDQFDTFFCRLSLVLLAQTLRVPQISFHNSVMNSAKIFSNNNKNLVQKFLTLSSIHQGKMPGTKRKSDGSSAQPNYEYWLIKSEPESRIEKGKKQN